MWEQRHQKERQQKQTDLALYTHNHQKDKEHVAAAAAAKVHDKEVMSPPAIPLHLPPKEKTLTTTMPPSPAPSVLVSIYQLKATPTRASSSSEGPGTTSASSLSPSLTKVVDLLDSTDIVDPLWQFWEHYLSDETDMDEPDEDSQAISEMELEYAGIPSTWEDRCRGHYGDTPTYHAVPSPTMDNDDGMLEGSMVEVSPAIEAALLRLEDTGKDQLAKQQTMPATQ